MTNYIKSKFRQSVSFPLVLVVAFSGFNSGLLFNARPSYAYNEADLASIRSGNGIKDHLPDLSNADLSYMNFHRAFLIGANLSYANLSYADLSSAELEPIGYGVLGQNIIYTNLNHANLNHANLNYANLINANLNSANLNGANLSGAILSGANLNGANLNGAIYNVDTLFPENFDPRKAGAIMKK
jgi:uncharacterized protein YjbI with pentapeptide repeats